MAEVQRRLESLTVEIEELTQVGFFSEEERTTLIKRHFEYENKINSMTKTIQDFKEYATYVISLYRIIRVRRNKLQIGDKKHHLEYRVLQRVKNLYEMAVARFPLEVDLFFSFFQFCKESNFQHASNTICQTMLRHHKNNEQVWLTAAQLTLHEKDDPEYAIKLLRQGIGIHKSSSALYTECIQYEIIQGMQGVKELTAEDEQIVHLNKKIDVYLQQAKKHIRDYTFYTNLLTFLQKYRETMGQQIGRIIKYLMETNDECAHAWDYLGQRELAGIHFDVENGEIYKVPMEKAFFNCVSTYEKGVDIIHEASRKRQLWDLYLTQIVNFKNAEKIINYNRILISAFEKASSTDCLSERFYFTWIDLVDDSRKRELLTHATGKQPLSVDLWTLRLRIEIVYDERNKVVAVFEEGYKILRDHADALPLWQTMHEYNVKVANSEEMEDFYLLAMQQAPNISIFYKAKYIQWLATQFGQSGLTNNIEKCRHVYKTLLKSEKPFCKEMYQVVHQLEMDVFATERDKTALESLHKLACEQVGDELVEVWINYIRFLIECKSAREAKTEIPNLMRIAKRKLNEDCVKSLESEYDAILSASTQRKMMRVSK